MSERMRLDEAVDLAGEWTRDMARRWRQTYHTAGIPPAWLADDTLSLARAIVEDATGGNALLQMWQRDYGTREQQATAREWFATMEGVHQQLGRLGLEAIDRLCERLAGAVVLAHAD